MGKTKIALIVAMDRERGIGLNGDMPWRLSADLKRFKKITMGHPVIMGRRTFESLPGGALPGRTNIVVSANPTFRAENVLVVGSPEEALKACQGAPLVFIIGGGLLYRHFLPLADLLYLTVIQHHYEADTRFPEFRSDDFILTERESHSDTSLFPYPFEFLTYEKKTVGQGTIHE